MTHHWLTMSTRWVMAAETSVWLEEAGSRPNLPPMVVLRKGTEQLTLSAPWEVDQWPEFVKFLRQFEGVVRVLANVVEGRIDTARVVRDAEERSD
ncbi:hypothetical protein [Amycolatopsis sp. NPDC059021]|uniref:hypothetical protein n=1 Tax=Amycolatopsis sp. NPDC059021 TaxID=3346704 RepID=UPI00366B01A5